MAPRVLVTGQCHCQTGHQRYQLPQSVNFPWYQPWNEPRPPAATAGHDLGSDADSDPDVDADADSNAGTNSTHGSDMVITDVRCGNNVRAGDGNEDEDEDEDEDENEDNNSNHDEQGSQSAVIENILSDYNHQIADQIADQADQVADHSIFNLETPALTAALSGAPLSPPPFGFDHLFPMDDAASSQEWSEGESELDFEPLQAVANNDPDEESPVPKLGWSRLNLTVLSQKFNIYAVAYGSAIHIFRVQSCVDHGLPARPDLTIKRPVSEDARLIHGDIDFRNPHYINHMVLGNLGEEEILLFACDDGDVLAYYTHQVEHALQRLELGTIPEQPLMPMKPFFHRNVGKSAWGLAAHKQSRLIAVGNNLHEIHIFAPALRSSSSGFENPAPPVSHAAFICKMVDPDGKVVFQNGAPVDPTEPLIPSRTKPYHIIIETRSTGNNIPNVAFSDGPDGEAEEIVAIDIQGRLHCANIGKDIKSWVRRGIKGVYESFYSKNPERIPPEVPVGWGVLIFTESSFLPTTTYKESLGLSPAESVYVWNKAYGHYISTNKAVQHIKDNSTVHPWVRQNQRHRFALAPRWISDQPLAWYNPTRDCEYQARFTHNDEAADRDSKRLPIDGQGPDNGIDSQNYTFLHNNTLLRTYQSDIELLDDPHACSIMLTDVIRQKRPPRRIVPGMPCPSERLCILLHVPELFLVVASSSCGRAVLITLTRPSPDVYQFRRGFKVEAILPTMTDEDRRLRPICPLLGVAVGPVHSSEGDNLPDGRPLYERRYRIMLHYSDHRILSYEVYRDMATSELAVV
ncbi:hypothetical protein F4777DRAFT_560282 [Nemania sp. FL0916]|nr:hypothetical protein F4777DRAFT_560282 [Nemania sp. FL0916]